MKTTKPNSTPWTGREDRTLGPAILVLAGVVALFETTNLDVRLQDRFFDFATHRWWIDASDPLWRTLCYTGPKGVIIGVGFALLVLTLAPVRWRVRMRVTRRDAGVALLALASVPALVGIGKSTTNVFCPSELRRYGGDVPYVRLGERFLPGDAPARRGRGFPAGHASGGFALVGLMWLRQTRAWRRGVLFLALGAGWWMGGYQMLRGAHFLSHTLTTMLLAWIVVLVWRWVLTPAPARAAEVRATAIVGRPDGGSGQSRV